MSFDSFVRSKTYKNIAAKLYGLGASAVIVGALFKIEHWTGASVLLTIGMLTESIIFFVSAFEPLHVEYDWSLAYPELAGMEEEEENKKKKKKEEKKAAKNGLTPSQNLDEMLSKAKIGPELIESLGKGLQNLSDTTSQLGNVTNAAASSEGFIKNLDDATQSVVELSASYRKTADYLNKDLMVSGEYLANVQDAASAVSTLSNIYKETALALTSGDSSYLNELKTMASSLSSINALYELQIQNSTAQLESTKQVQEKIDNLVVNFADTAENVLRYKEQVNALSKKVTALNDIYGNMLAAMQTR
ncbi:MAG: gliding motility protein GldL [Bacteroidales bacterium]|jgi:gliding motility-associated protein GldL|nr:gliding motility protein GldL [Bacteroidales bacterium]